MSGVPRLLAALTQAPLPLPGAGRGTWGAQCKCRLRGAARSLAGFGASRTKVQVWTLPLPGSGTRGKSPGTYVPQFPSLKWARFSSESPVSCVTSLPPLFPHCLAGVCPLMSTPLPSVPLGPRRGMSEFSSYSPEKLSLHRAAEGVMGWRPLRP